MSKVRNSNLSRVHDAASKVMKWPCLAVGAENTEKSRIVRLPRDLTQYSVSSRTIELVLRRTRKGFVRNFSNYEGHRYKYL